jgi:hypothetical protein
MLAAKACLAPPQQTVLAAAAEAVALRAVPEMATTQAAPVALATQPSPLTQFLSAVEAVVRA